jgi:hypothetical protein
VRLVAVLLNPVPHERVTLSQRNVATAAEVLRASSWQIANLVTRPTRDLPGLSQAASDEDPWLLSRPALSCAIAEADVLLLGWGLGGLTGPAARHWRSQASWACVEARRHGHRTGLTLGGSPRHPSRWRQYLGPKRGLYPPGPWEERLAAALQATPLPSDLR